MTTSDPLEYPTPAQVLEHGFDFRPAWWQSRVPERDADFLDALPVAQQGRRYHHISRRDLLTAHRGASLDLHRRLLVSCYVWGTGDGGWLAPRRARVFRDTEPVSLGQHLAAATSILAGEGPAAAYAALSDGGPHRIKHMRASFFTKFLYAADAPGDGEPGRALILDQFVAIALNDRQGWGLPERSGWTPETYQAWLDFAHERAAAESDRAGTVVRPDAVEMAYFLHGRRLASERKQQRQS